MLRLTFLSMLLVGNSCLLGQDAPLEKRDLDGREIELFRNTVSMSQATAINNQGSVVGTREIFVERVSAFRPLCFYSGVFGTKDIPIPETFTNFEATGISDTEVVAGYATRPMRHKDGSLRGAVWDAKTGQFALLPLPEGDRVNQAQAISADGKRISGYTTGPERLRPVVWEFNEKERNWTITVLPTVHENNPYLVSGRLVISPNGKWIAGCCSEEFRSDGVIDSSLFLWSQTVDGRWERKKLSSEQMYLYGMNDLAEMVGAIRGETAVYVPCYISPNGQIVLLELLPGDVSGEAKAINNSSMIVGFSDDPMGTEGGPELCIWSKDGKAERAGQPGVTYGAILGVNDAGQIAGAIEVNPNDDSVQSAESTENLLLAFRSVKPK